MNNLDAFVHGEVLKWGETKQQTGPNKGIQVVAYARKNKTRKRKKGGDEIQEDDDFNALRKDVPLPEDKGLPRKRAKTKRDTDGHSALHLIITFHSKFLIVLALLLFLAVSFFSLVAVWPAGMVYRIA